jgi:acetoin utilization protein AcuA
MMSTVSRQSRIDTERGPVILLDNCSADDLVPLNMDISFTHYARYNPIISEKISLERAIADPHTIVVVAATETHRIIGFAILEPAGPDDRWSRLPGRLMMEVAVVEVSRSWRSLGLSKAMLRLLTGTPVAEDRILYMVGYSWTWDLEGAGLAAIDYRTMMIRLFRRFGFEVFQTNEPNVMLRPENLFMARIGSRVAADRFKQFRLVLFNLDL